MQEFCHLLLFSGLITYVSLAPAIPNSRKHDLETIIDQTLKLSHNITPDPGEKRKLTIVSEEFNREDPKCVQTHIKMFIGGLQKKDQAIIENLREMATLFNASSCPSLNEDSCNFHTTDHKEFKAQLIQFLNEIPSDCQKLKPRSSTKS